VLLYLVGSELRIASEERELAQKFPEDYAAYRTRTRWRYLPGLR
jgi:protein-S-isoprenylcysteine O-methyltransferase Ste14